MGKTAGGVRAIELEDGDKPANIMVYKDEPFILVYTNKKGKLLNFEDLRVWKRAKRGQIAATLEKGEKIKGAIGIEEGAVRIKNQKDEYITIHSNDILLAMPQDELEPMIKTGTIQSVFRPWEEKEENMKYKEDKKAKAKAEKQAGKETDEENNGLFTADEKQEDSNAAEQKTTETPSQE